MSISSILNNSAANTALLNLENTNTNLQNVQNQISTGLAVNSAADNASYYSIATVLRSDSSALSTVSNTLNLGDSSLGVANTALSQISTTLSDIKDQLVAATAPGADLKVIQEQITQDQAQLKSIAQSANFNGQNFLSINSAAPSYNATQSFVSSYSRNGAGQISVGYIDVNTANTALFDSNNGSYHPAASGAITTSLTPSTASATPPTGVSGTSAYTATVVNGQLQITSYTADPANAGKYFANTITVGNTSGASAPVVTESVGSEQAAVNAGDTLGGVATGANAPTYVASTKTLTFQVAENGDATAGKVQYHTFTVNNFVPSGGAGILDKVDSSTVGSYTDANGVTTTTTAGTGASIATLNISSLTGSAADQATLNAYQQQVDAAISNVASSASTLGTAQSRITAQSSFISSLQTSINNGVGSLVDADLNTASTRLQALQVQQQLGVQSLSIANQSAQAILKLFP